MTQERIEQAARGVPGFYGSETRVATSDGYLWRLTLAFKIRTSTRPAICIAIPWPRDLDCRDGSRLDRSPAVYLRQCTNESDANAILGLLIAGL